jgi:hypothetical protein
VSRDSRTPLWIPYGTVFCCLNNVSPRPTHLLITGTYVEGFQHSQYYPQGYQQQQPPWQYSGQQIPATYAQYAQTNVPAAHSPQQFSAYPAQQQQAQQPSWKSEGQPAWYGAQQVACEGQAAAMFTTTITAEQQPPAYGYSPEGAAHAAQQGYAYTSADTSHQHPWQAHQAQQQYANQTMQPNQQQQAWQAHQAQQQQQQETYTQQQQQQEMFTQQQNQQEAYTRQQQQQQQQDYYLHQQQCQHHYQYQDYATAAYSPYNYPQQYQPHQQHAVQYNPPATPEAQMRYQPDLAEGSQHANSVAPTPQNKNMEQKPTNPTVQEAPPKPPVLDVESLLFEPYRATRPPAIVVLVRGIPGSGKSWLAQRLRAIEMENGGKAPRVLSIDPYFIVDDDENADARATNCNREKYVYDASKEGVQMPMDCACPFCSRIFLPGESVQTVTLNSDACIIVLCVVLCSRSVHLNPTTLNVCA